MSNLINKFSEKLHGNKDKDYDDDQDDSNRQQQHQHSQRKGAGGMKGNNNQFASEPNSWGMNDDVLDTGDQYGRTGQQAASGGNDWSGTGMKDSSQQQHYQGGYSRDQYAGDQGYQQSSQQGYQQSQQRNIDVDDDDNDYFDDDDTGNRGQGRTSGRTARGGYDNAQRDQGW